MCGIVGCLVLRDSDFLIDYTYLNDMRDVDSMKLRGPDGSGSWISNDQKVGLAHRRLSIIDPSPNAAQPMKNDDGKILISFNGEIYNHKELRRELELLERYKWKTDHSDTEVILHAFEEWGIGCIKRLRGMFAIAIWDGYKDELWLIRDRLGIKPLYYSMHNERLVFSSDINALLADKDQKRVVNEKALYDYLSFLVSPAPETLFEGICKLENSTYLRVKRNGNLEFTRYWDLLENKINLDGYSEAELHAMLVEVIRESVVLHKESDVPVGVFLSGGIDSSLNAILFSEEGNKKVDTFTISFSDISNASNNENKTASYLSNKIGATHYERELAKDDIMSVIPDLIKLQGEPLADPIAGAQYYLSKLARDNGIIVSQIGEGLDELFIGYPRWIKFIRFAKLLSINLPIFLRKLILLIYGIIGGRQNMQYEILRRYSCKEAIFWGTNDIFLESNKSMLLSKRMKSKFKNYSSWNVIKTYHDRYLTNKGKNSFFRWMTYIDLNFRLPDLLLTKVDKMGMGVSLEARVPFLDHKLVEFVMSIPDEMMTGLNNDTKYFLKNALVGLLPSEILTKKKIGFVLPVADWYQGDLKKSIKDEVHFFCDKVDYFDNVEIEKVLDDGNTWKIWSLYTLALWWRLYIAG